MNQHIGTEDEIDGTDTATQSPSVNNLPLHASTDDPSVSPTVLEGGATPSAASDNEVLRVDAATTTPASDNEANAITADYLHMGGATISTANDNEAIAAEYLRVIGDRLQASDIL